MCSGDRVRLYTSIVFLLFSASVQGQAGKNYTYRFGGDLCTGINLDGDQSLTIQYSITELSLEGLNTENGEFYRLTIPGHIPTSYPGKPQFPVLSRLISIPAGASYKIKISDIKSSIINPGKKNFKGLLFPSQPGETKVQQGKKPGFMIDKDQYNAPGFLKTDTVTVTSLGKLRGRQLADLVISPVRFNPRSNELEVITSMKIDIEFSEPGVTLSKSADPNESLLFASSLSKSLLNFNPEDVINGYSDHPVKMIVLTDTAFKKLLRPLIRWKTQKGFDITTLYRGKGLAGSTYAELKDTIAGIFRSASSKGLPPEYLLIIGDVNRIPAVSGISNVSDMYYGEFDGDGDYIPDMYIGRLPVADTNELKTVVSKIVQYEKFEFADTNTFYSRALITAGNDNAYAGYMNGQVKYAITNYLNTENNISEYHFYNPLSTQNNIEDSIKFLVKKGVSFINYSGHGDAQGWLDPKIKVPEVDLFENKSMYPFVISNACKTGQFSSSPSFGNKMVVSDHKGAIGFIGCTNDSYWTEDFYWSVGVGTPSQDATYQNTGLGAYDRLFHTHGESPSDWYFTMGQVNYAGNLAVSASTSPYKKYYWETYSLIGDPSVIPIIGTPGTFNINLPDTLPNGMETFSATIEPFAYMAVSRHDTLIDASFASPSGSISLDLPSPENDSCLVVVTGQNRKPLIKTVYFSDIETEYINISSVSFNDSPGNRNGITEFNEAAYLNMVISNMGISDATGLYVKISTTSEWLTIEHDSALVGTIKGKSQFNLADILKFKISDYVPDMGMATIDLIVKDDLQEKKYKIDVIIHAPKLEILNCKINDSLLGNSNFVPEPGETVDLVFRVFNSGSSDIAGTFSTNTQNSGITIIDKTAPTGILKFGEITEIPVTVRFEASVLPGTSFEINSLLDCTPYIKSKSFTFSAGMTRESFENQSFKVFPWLNPVQYPWIISDKTSFDGSFSAASAMIPNSTESVLAIKVNSPVADTVRFMVKVSSESNYDFLSFHQNKTEKFKISGESGWLKKEVILREGFNLLEWIYKKDQNLAAGYDRAWLDYISFPVLSFMKTDLKLEKITIPIPEKGYKQETIKANVISFGRDTLYGFNLAYQVNGEIPVMQHFDKAIFPGDTITVSFSQAADLSHGGTYNIMAYGINNNDRFLHNDTASLVIVNTSSGPPDGEEEKHITVAPNPFKENFRIIIDTGAEDNILLTLFDFSGRKLMEEERQILPGKNSLFISAEEIQPGICTLKIAGKTISGTLRIVKIR